MARRHHRRFVRLVDRLEVGSVSEAVAVIVAGHVTVNGMVITNPHALIAADAVVALVAERILRGSRRLPDLVKDIHLVEIEGGPHNIGWTHPEEMNKAFVDFLAE